MRELLRSTGLLRGCQCEPSFHEVELAPGERINLVLADTRRILRPRPSRGSTLGSNFRREPLGIGSYEIGSDPGDAVLVLVLDGQLPLDWSTNSSASFLDMPLGVDTADLGGLRAFVLRSPGAGFRACSSCANTAIAA